MYRLPAQGQRQDKKRLFLAMANFGAHATFLTALFAATLTRLFCTQ